MRSGGDEEMWLCVVVVAVNGHGMRGVAGAY